MMLNINELTGFESINTLSGNIESATFESDSTVVANGNNTLDFGTMNIGAASSNRWLYIFINSFYASSITNIYVNGEAATFLGILDFGKIYKINVTSGTTASITAYTNFPNVSVSNVYYLYVFNITNLSSTPNVTSIGNSISVDESFPTIESYGNIRNNAVLICFRSAGKNTSDAPYYQWVMSYALIFDFPEITLSLKTSATSTNITFDSGLTKVVQKISSFYASGPTLNNQKAIFIY